MKSAISSSTSEKSTEPTFLDQQYMNLLKKRHEQYGEAQTDKLEELNKRESHRIYDQINELLRQKTGKSMNEKGKVQFLKTLLYKPKQVGNDANNQQLIDDYVQKVIDRNNQRESSAMSILGIPHQVNRNNDADNMAIHEKLKLCENVAEERKGIIMRPMRIFAQKVHAALNAAKPMLRSKQYDAAIDLYHTIAKEAINEEEVDTFKSISKFITGIHVMKKEAIGLTSSAIWNSIMEEHEKKLHDFLEQQASKPEYERYEELMTRQILHNCYVETGKREKALEQEEIIFNLPQAPIVMNDVPMVPQGAAGITTGKKIGTNNLATCLMIAAHSANGTIGITHIDHLCSVETIKNFIEQFPIDQPLAIHLAGANKDVQYAKETMNRTFDALKHYSHINIASADLDYPKSMAYVYDADKRQLISALGIDRHPDAGLAKLLTHIRKDGEILMAFNLTSPHAERFPLRFKKDFFIAIRSELSSQKHTQPNADITALVRYHNVRRFLDANLTASKQIYDAVMNKLPAADRPKENSIHKGHIMEEICLHDKVLGHYAERENAGIAEQILSNILKLIATPEATLTSEQEKERLRKIDERMENFGGSFEHLLNAFSGSGISPLEMIQRGRSSQRQSSSSSTRR